jgi:stage II sporulation protein AA (anti-sigma F factor antagonist)
MDVYLNFADENETTIRVRGEVDLTTAGELLLRLTVLVGAATGQIALDLEQVTFMDCSGLRTLSAIEGHVRSAGGSLRISALSPQVARVFELAGQSGSLPWIAAALTQRGPWSDLRHGGTLPGLPTSAEAMSLP